MLPRISNQIRNSIQHPGQGILGPCQRQHHGQPALLGHLSRFSRGEHGLKQCDSCYRTLAVECALAHHAISSVGHHGVSGDLLEGRWRAEDTWSAGEG